MASGGRTCSSGSPRVSGLRAQEATPGELVQGAGLGCLQVPDPLGCLRLPRDPGRELVAAREVPGPPRVAWAQCEGSCSQRASTNSCPQKDTDLGTPGATPVTCAAQDLPSPGQEITAPCLFEIPASHARSRVWPSFQTQLLHLRLSGLGTVRVCGHRGSRRASWGWDGRGRGEPQLWGAPQRLLAGLQCPAITDDARCCGPDAWGPQTSLCFETLHKGTII